MGERVEVNGRKFEYRKHDDGTWWLLCWEGERSFRIGVYGSELMAATIAKNIPPDIDIRKAAERPHAGFGFKADETSRS